MKKRMTVAEGIDLERAKTDLVYAVNTLVPVLNERDLAISLVWSRGKTIQVNMIPYVELVCLKKPTCRREWFKCENGSTPAERMSDALARCFVAVMEEGK